MVSIIPCVNAIDRNRMQRRRYVAVRKNKEDSVDDDGVSDAKRRASITPKRRLKRQALKRNVCDGATIGFTPYFIHHLRLELQLLPPHHALNGIAQRQAIYSNTLFSIIKMNKEMDAWRARTENPHETEIEQSHHEDP